MNVLARYCCLLLLVVITGCETMPSPSTIAQRLGEPVKVEVQALHDYELKVGETLVTGASIRSIMERYGNDPRRLWGVFVLGGYTDEMGGLMRYLQQTQGQGR